MKRIFILISVFVIAFAAKAQVRVESPDRLGKENKLPSAADPSLKGTPVKRFFWGRNYRPEWVTPVSAPLLDLKKEFGQSVALKEGGGKQTHSLHLEDQHGQKWALRSLKKFPDKALPSEFKGTVAAKIVKDAISASYPYGALPVGPLSHAAGIPYLKTQLVYLPDDSLFREFKTPYGKALYILEGDKQEKSGNPKPMDTQELIIVLQKNSLNQVDQVALLRARILDNFIMDFDRHEDQWSWVKNQDTTLALFEPIPKDRDQAFFNINGFFPSLLKNMQFFHQFQGLRAKTKNISTFNFAPRNLDRAFLTQLDRGTWSRETDRFLSTMTDSVIESAFQKIPSEIQNLSAKKIIGILKEKRKYLKNDMMDYYTSLAKTVAITGSNEREEFSIDKQPDGRLMVMVHHMDSSGKPDALTYKRVFDPKETREIRIYGLEGDDRFLISGGDSKINIRLIGGPGKDEFRNEGHGGKIYAYDVCFESNRISGQKGIKNKFSGDPMTNEYRRLGFVYDASGPDLQLEYGDDGGFYLGPSYKIIKQGFGKEPYASKQSISIRKALNAPSYQASYEGEFISLVKKEDLVIRTDLKIPTGRTRFYGFGNNTTVDKTMGPNTYYLARYVMGNLSVMGLHHFAPWLQLKYGPSLQYLKLSDEKNEGKFVQMLYPPGLPNHLNKSTWYAGGGAEVDADTRNSESFPTRGVDIGLQLKNLKHLGGTNDFTEMTGHLSLYTDAIFPKHLVLATSFGAGHNQGDYEFPQAQYLGFKEGLRGFRLQRFSGRSKVYNNTEVRARLGNLNLYLVKGSIGILGFHDVGRVWSDGEHSSTWHRGYGEGIWFAPLDKWVIALTLTNSSEEKNFAILNFGFQF